MSDFEKKFVQSYKILSNTKDLSPENKTVCQILSSLIEHATNCYECDFDIEFNPSTLKLIPNFRRICSDAEELMEKHWSEYFLNKPTLSLDNLKEFWYYDNYAKITQKEIALMKNYFSEDKNISILFAGSGALPLTAILMYQAGYKNITIIDIDWEAINKSQNLFKKLGIDINIYNQDVFQHNLDNYDLICIASLIPNKTKIINKIKKSNAKHYLMRGADGIYKIFYENLSDDIKASSPHMYYPSDKHTINSSYLFKKQ